MGLLTYPPTYVGAVAGLRRAVWLRFGTTNSDAPCLGLTPPPDRPTNEIMTIAGLSLGTRAIENCCQPAQIPQTIQ